MDYSPLTLTAIQTALSAGDLLRKGFGTHFNIFEKPGPHNIATEFDHAAEKLIIASIKEKFPNHAFLAEESGATQFENAPVTWIIDPLDGTTNFSRSIPLFAVNIAAVENQEICTAVTYVPMLQELFVAEKGKGAFLNGNKLKVSPTTHFERVVSAAGFPYDIDKEAMLSLELFVKISQQGNPVRDLGSAAICMAYVAAGRIDAFWNSGLYPWDFAAGKLMIEESGGKVTQYNSKELSLTEHSSVLATNGLVHDQILQYL